MSNYPIHDKLKSLSVERTAIANFLDWLDDPDQHCQVVCDDDGNRVAELPKRWAIAYYPTRTHNNGLLDESEWWEDYEATEVGKRKEEIIGAFLEIDPAELEAEKRQMLAEIRKGAKNE